MRWLSFLFAMLALGGYGRAWAVEFPYVAFVNSGDVYVRSGPGRDYYPTDKLHKGEKVEIYRHDPGGWYAIRPPRQSFSWVSARHLDVAGKGVATVNSPRVVARVGSAFSDVRDVIQVRLDKGEQVELFDSPASESPWCKISPPSGEFRWVFSKYVNRDGAPDAAEDENEDSPASDGDDARATKRPERDVRLASDFRENEPTTPDSDASEPIASLEPTGRTESTYVSREVDRIELELSAMVVEETAEWSFERLQRRAEVLLNESQTPTERGCVRVLLAKLSRFEDIKQRHLANIQAGGEISRRPSAPTGVELNRDGARFDGVGRLSPVISEKVGGPQFALVDTSNTVISFVTAAPGVNLRPFIDKYVGVNGQRGYMTDLHRQHISVQRVTLLDAQRR